jgi:hypothetical protein
VKEKYFILKYRPAGISLTVTAMICLKFKLQLKLRNNKKILFYNWKFLYAKKCIGFKLKFGKNRNCLKRTAHWHSVTSLLLETLKQRLIDVTSFRLSKSRCAPPVLFKHTVNFGFVFKNLVDGEIYDTKFPTPDSFLFFHSVFVVPL